MYELTKEQEKEIIKICNELRKDTKQNLKDIEADETTQEIIDDDILYYFEKVLEIF